MVVPDVSQNHLRKKNVKLDQCTYLSILDETDEITMKEAVKKDIVNSQRS
ncbi:hypothetical protein KHA80_20225 [Anaerobacillus sp. HL2]|nr:hypothetical protein KHA80_20225 [Anaerobacillus sp. HL2]